MTAALAPRAGLPGVRTDQGYALPPDLTFEEWSNVLRLVDYIAAASSWWLADAMVYGEEHFGEAHSQALPTAEEDPFGASQSRMKQAGWMGRVYPPNTRVPGASYTHHRAVADLPPAERTTLLSEVAKAAHDVAEGVPGARPISTRALVEKVKARQVALAGTVVEAESEPAPLPLSVEDLTDEARAALVYRRGKLPAKHHAAYERAWVDCLIWTDQRDCFTRWLED